MLHLNRRHGASKFIGVSAVFVFFCLLYLYLRDTPVACVDSTIGAILGEQDPSAPATSTNYTARSKIAKVTVAANALNGGIIHRAMKSHDVHNQRHGYHHFIAKNQAVSELIEHDTRNRPKGAWTKPAYLLSVIVNELEKEEHERLEWIFWFDADTIVLNPYTPLEVFVPPKSHRDLDDVHLMLSSNWDGLNSGAFALRVHPWSVSFMSAVLAYPIYETERQKKDRFRDQSAFQFLLENPESPMAVTPMKGKEHWAQIPMRWFNSLPFNNAFAKGGKWIYATNMTDAKFDNGTLEIFDDGNGPEIKAWKIMQGDMAVHFAGATAGSKGVRDSWMGRWLDRAEQMLPYWANETTQDGLRKEASQFWSKTAKSLSDSRKKLSLGGDTLLTDKSPPPPPPPKPKSKEEPKKDKKSEQPKDSKALERASETAKNSVQVDTKGAAKVEAENPLNTDAKDNETPKAEDTSKQNTQEEKRKEAAKREGAKADENASSVSNP